MPFPYQHRRLSPLAPPFWPLTLTNSSSLASSLTSRPCVQTTQERTWRQNYSSVREFDFTTIHDRRHFDLVNCLSRISQISPVSSWFASAVSRILQGLSPILADEVMAWLLLFYTCSWQSSREISRTRNFRCVNKGNNMVDTECLRIPNPHVRYGRRENGSTFCTLNSDEVRFLCGLRVVVE